MRVPRTGAWLVVSIVAALIAAFSASLPRPAGATYLPQERIPTDSPIYRDLERLAASYGAAPRFLSSRPLRRAEAMAYLRGLAEANPGVEADPAFARAARWVDPGAAGATRPWGVVKDDENQERLEVSPYGSILYSDDPRNEPDVNRDYRVGVAAAAAMDSSSIVVVNLYEGTASQGGRGTPDFGDFNSLIEGVNFNSYVNEAYVEVPVSKIRLLFGHTWLRWGPGAAGSLALSDAAPALDLFRAEAGMFGVVRYGHFVALLDPGPETYMAGHRLEWQPSGRLSVGLTELARFDGTSQVALYLIPFVPYSYWEKRPKTGGVTPADSSGNALRKNNVLWSADAAWSIRPGLRAHGEFLLDDISFSTDYKPDMIGYQAGIDWRRRVRGRDAIGLAAEYTRVHNFVYSAWHGHHFEFQGFPVGFVLGPDVQVVGAEVAYELGDDWEFRLRGEWQRRGEGRVGDPWVQAEGEVDASEFQGVVERETRGSFGATYSPARWLRLEVRVAASSFRNLRHVASTRDDEATHALGARVEW